MIEIKDLTKVYGTNTLFENISFVINNKERIGLVGRNGYGKTTLFKIIMNLELPDEGEIILPKNYKIGYLEQDITFTKSDIISECSLALPQNMKNNDWIIKKYLTGLGFTENDFSKNPNIFSGGFQIRINLVKVLVSEPDLLLLDEPTNYLDILSIRWLSDFLKNWKSELILITHDRTFMDSVITHTAGIYRKNIKKIPGITSNYYEYIANEDEIHEKTRVNIQKKKENNQKFIQKFRAKARLAGLVQSRIKMLEKQTDLVKLQEIKNIEFDFNYKSFPAKYLMSADKLSFSYDTKKEQDNINTDKLITNKDSINSDIDKSDSNKNSINIDNYNEYNKHTENINYIIKDFSLSVKVGDKICIIGPNGKGKSTLMKLFNEILSPDCGSIDYHNETEIGYFAQENISFLNEENTVEDEIYHSNYECTNQVARNICGTFMFSEDDAFKKISVLSGGERSRVSFAKIITKEVNLLLLDEPTNHLDIETCEALAQAINRFKGAVILVTHNEMLLNAVSNRLVIFDRNKISVYEGTYNEFLESIGWESDEEWIKSKDNNSSKKSSKTDIKKMDRRRRAEIIQEKSSVITPVKNEINYLENEISKLDKTVSENNKIIIESSKTNDFSKVITASNENDKLKKVIDDYYEKLEPLLEQFDELTNKYETLMNNI